jgi:UDP-N-acetylglucosamine--N-acetylmuramyl-(pentapeptide) pyrophosphoryl-undecaprenol N-acetylglucosamine transferase
MVEALGILKQGEGRLFIIHQTGEADFPWVKQAYEERGIRARVEPFLYEMGEAYAQASLVVSRAGATTVAEVTACGLPAILIPYPFAAHDHQKLNAEVMKKVGAAVVIEDAELTGSLLAQEILRLLHDPEGLRQMGAASRSLGHPRAAADVVDLCLSLMKH